LISGEARRKDAVVRWGEMNSNQAATPSVSKRAIKFRFFVVPFHLDIRRWMRGWFRLCLSL